MLQVYFKILHSIIVCQYLYINHKGINSFFFLHRLFVQWGAGGAFTRAEDLILSWKSRNFYHMLSPKVPLFCVLEHPKFIFMYMSQKNKTKQNKTKQKKNIFTEKSLIFVTKILFFFLINFVSERSLLFKFLIHIYVALYKSCAMGYLRPRLSAVSSGVARAFPGGRVAHLDDQNEEENEENLRKNERKYRKMRKDWGNTS